MRTFEEILPEEKVEVVLETLKQDAVYNLIRASTLDQFKPEFSTFINRIDEEINTYLSSNRTTDNQKSLSEFNEEQRMQSVRSSQSTSALTPEQYFLTAGATEFNVARQFKLFSATLNDILETDDARTEYKQALEEFANHNSEDEALESFLHNNERVLNFLYLTSTWLSQASNHPSIAGSKLINEVSSHISDGEKEQYFKENYEEEIAEKFSEINQFFKEEGSAELLNDVVNNFNNFKKVIKQHDPDQSGLVRELLENIKSQEELIDCNNQMKGGEDIFYILQNNKNKLLLIHDLVTILQSLPQEARDQIKDPNPSIKRGRLAESATDIKGSSGTQMM